MPSTDTIQLPSAPRPLQPDQPTWPVGLARLSGSLRPPPCQLRCAGQLPADAQGVAVVGTRAADPEALEFAFQLGAGLAAAGLWTVSGGALGIDGAAHRGALQAGGATLAVLATGLRRAYPPAHGALFSRIVAAGGGLLTEAQDTGAPRRPLFLRRNALIAAMCRAVVVVQAPRKSGALSTAAWAKTMQIPVFAVPGSPWEARSEGANLLLRQGALVCTSPRDVLSLRPASDASSPPKPSQRGRNDNDCENMDPDDRLVWQVLGRRGQVPDQLALRLGMPMFRIQRSLLMLELEGRARRHHDGRYTKS